MRATSLSVASAGLLMVMCSTSTAWAQCPCGPVFFSNAQNRSFQFYDGTVPSTIRDLATAAGNQWNNAMSQGSMNPGSGDINIVFDEAGDLAVFDRSFSLTLYF